jgi:hypothetical protein
VVTRQLEVRGVRCAEKSRAWSELGSRVIIQVTLVGCSYPGVIEMPQQRLDRLLPHVGSPASAIPYAVETLGQARLGGVSYQDRRVVFRCDGVLAVAELLTRSAPTNAAASTLLDVASQQAASLPGHAGPGFRGIDTSALTRLVVRDLGRVIVYVGVILLIMTWLRRRRLTAKGIGLPPRSSDRVTVICIRGRARRLALAARCRFGAQLVAVYLLVVSLGNGP